MKITLDKAVTWACGYAWGSATVFAAVAICWLLWG
jgi:hypothetical protein